MNKLWVGLYRDIKYQISTEPFKLQNDKRCPQIQRYPVTRLKNMNERRDQSVCLVRYVCVTGSRAAAPSAAWPTWQRNSPSLSTSPARSSPADFRGNKKLVQSEMLNTGPLMLNNRSQQEHRPGERSWKWPPGSNRCRLVDWLVSDLFTTSLVGDIRSISVDSGYKWCSLKMS